MTDVDKETINKLRPLFEAIKEFKKNNPYKNSWPNHNSISGVPSDLYPNVDSELIDIFSDMCPTSEDGIHSIEHILIYEKINEERLL